MAQIARAGIALEEAQVEAIELDDGLSFYWVAYDQLSSERPITEVGNGLIPWRAIAAYVDFYDLSPVQAECLFYFVQGLDLEYGSIRTAEYEKRTKRTRKKPLRKG